MSRKLRDRMRNKATLPVKITRPPQRTFSDILQERIQGELGVFFIEGERYEARKGIEGDVIGEGFYGQVFKVEVPCSSSSDKSVFLALKTIEENMTRPDAREQMLKDLEIVKDSQHENIVKYVGYDFREAKLYIYMELLMIDWQCIYQKVAEHNSTVPNDVLEKVTISTVKALKYLHDEKKVMHRDIKPNNILLGFDGVVKICDFGVSKQQENSRTILARTQGVGSQYYVPPEAFKVEYSDPEHSVVPSRDALAKLSAPVYDSRRDVWALGVTIVEISMQQYPFEKANEFDKFNAIAEQPAPSLSDQYSEKLRTFIKACLEKHEANRPKWTSGSMKYEESLGEFELMTQPEDSLISNEDMLKWYHSISDDPS